MNPTRKESTEYARLLCGKYKSTSTHALMRMMLKKYPLMSENAARCAIRVRRGALGEKHRREVKAVERYDIPESRSVVYAPVKIDKGTVGLLSDIHIPYHDTKALKCALNWLETEKPDTILLNGDIVDFYQVSSFDRDPTQDGIIQEAIAARRFLAGLRKAYPKARIIYREGNHEYRFTRFILAHAVELFGVEEFGVESLLRLKEHGIEWVNAKRIIYAGDLALLHGHELAGGISAPVNPARGLFLQGKDSALMGHSHRTSEHTEKTINGKVMTTWSVGCLCDLAPRYRPINNFNHGCASIHIYKGGGFHVKNKRIIDGVMV